MRNVNGQNHKSYNIIGRIFKAIQYFIYTIIT